MQEAKRRKIERAGWKVGNVKELFKLTAHEARLIEEKAELRVLLDRFKDRFKVKANTRDKHEEPSNQLIHLLAAEHILIMEYLKATEYEHWTPLRGKLRALVNKISERVCLDC